MERPRTKDHVPPLLRGIGFALILLASVVVGVGEYRANAGQRDRAAQVRARMDAQAAASREDGRADAIAAEIRMLRQQLQDEDLADKVFENPWFQLIGVLGTGLVAVSFLYEAWAKWPRRFDPGEPPFP